MTEFGDILAKEIENKKNDINSFVWKSSNGNDVRMMDMDADGLQKAYNHANSMLTSRDRWTPGKLVIRENLHKTWDECNIELFKRFMIHEANVGFTTNKDLLDYILAAKKQYEASDLDSISVIMSGVPTIYERVTIGDLLNACFDKLGAFNKKLLSDKFILSQGIWLTDDEKKELTEYEADGTMRKWLDVVKERLFLANVRLRIDQKGLSYSEFRSLIQMDKLPKISALPTATLKLLRDKILLLLDGDLNYHIDKWMGIMSQLEKVAEYKGITLGNKE